MNSDNIKALLKRIHESDEVEKHTDFDDSREYQTLATLAAVGYVQIDDLSDIVVLTTQGRLWAGIRDESEADFSVERLAEHTGNIPERELAAMYIERKMRAADMHATADASNRACYETVGRVLNEIAHELRIGMHLPEVHIEGRVIPYNEDRSTGIRHADALRTFFTDVHERNVRAGWWSDITTGEPKKRNVGEMFTLIVTEIVEAYTAWVEKANDDKLTHHPGIGVELADALIRLADFAGALAAGRIVDSGHPVFNPGDRAFLEIAAIGRHYESIRKTPEAVGEPEQADFLEPMDVAIMTDEKLAFNAKREDHKIENRLKEDGKRT